MEEYNSTAESIDVGARLKKLRQERGLSIRALARASELSANAISVIERGRSSPSVSTLYKITGALGIPITSIFLLEGTRKDIVLCKHNSRTRIPLPRGLWEGLGGEDFSGRVEAFMITLEAGASSGPHPLKHSGHEFVFCLRGNLEYQVDQETFHLETGDSLLFVADLGHFWRNPGSSVTNALILITDFEPGEQPAEHHLLTSQAPDSRKQEDIAE